ncbi:MAG: hypothetical protein E7E64_04910 [Clostridium celatum]|uniref:hypothetical protein n=1 Tax=Clostridium tertium TaxID=1559 RepID=UPI0028FE18A4|nr:hypothetical protein [Clostridium celatum]
MIILSLIGNVMKLLIQNLQVIFIWGIATILLINVLKVVNKALKVLSSIVFILCMIVKTFGLTNIISIFQNIIS